MSTKLLEIIATPENLLTAWRVVRGNVPKYRRQRASGPDGISLADFEQDLEMQLSVLRDMLVKGRYQPEPPAYFTIPKKGGGQRMLAILPVRDRVAQRAVQQVLDPLWDPHFLPCSFGYRPGISIEQAVAQAHDLRNDGLRWVVDGDIANCFDSINHDILMTGLKRRVKDSRVLSLIQAWLDAGVMNAGPPLNIDMALATRLEKLKDTARRGMSWALDSVAREADPFGHYDYEPTEYKAYSDKVDPAVERNTITLGVRQAAIRQVVASGLMIGAGFIRRKGASFFSGVGISSRQLLASPMGRRLLKRGVVASGGLAGLAATAAITAYVLNRRAGPGPSGVLQGSPLSPLLANIYLHPFDVNLTKNKYRLIRFADDWVILCHSRDEAEHAYNNALRALSRLQLKINREKTKILTPDDQLAWLGTIIA